jgi:hypothetical protein
MPLFRATVGRWLPSAIGDAREWRGLGGEVRHAVHQGPAIGGRHLTGGRGQVGLTRLIDAHGVGERLGIAGIEGSHRRGVLEAGGERLGRRLEWGGGLGFRWLGLLGQWCGRRLFVGNVAAAVGGTGLIVLQPLQIADECLVHGDDTGAGGSAGCAQFAAQRVVDGVGHKFVQHEAMAGEHRLDRVARQHPHDGVNGRLGAGDLLLFCLAVALGYGFGHVAQEMGEKLVEAESRLGFHDAGASLGW